MSFNFPTPEEIRASADKRAAEEERRRKTLYFTGHRPDDLGVKCYLKSDLGFQYIIDNTEDHLKRIIEEREIEDLVFGGALGWDTVAFFMSYGLKDLYPGLKLHLSIPFEQQPFAWVPSKVALNYKRYADEGVSVRQYLEAFYNHDLSFIPTIRQYYEMYDLADSVTFVDTIRKYFVTGVGVGTYHVAKMKNCNLHMIDQGDTCCSLYNGRPTGGTAGCLKESYRLGRTVYTINPNRDFEMEVRYGWV